MRNLLTATFLAALLGTSLATFWEHLEKENKCHPVDAKVDNDAFKSVKQIVKENGYAIEQYMITTSDGYILTLFRLPGYLNDTLPYAKKPVVLLSHGLTGDSSQWVLNSPDRATAFNLVNNGFDVWMGNNRGCKYGVEHKSLDPNDPVDKPIFWNFDFEDMGTKDTPAFMDFILEQTGQEKLSIVGHSEGNTQIFAGAAMMPEYYKAKTSLLVALAPVTNI